MMLINGREGAGISLLDRGLHYGDGLFETMVIRGGEPSSLWDRHMARLYRGCERLGIMPPDPAMLEREARTCCHGVDAGVLKIIITRGGGGRGYRAPDRNESTRILLAYPPPAWPDTYRDEGITLRICDTRLGRNQALAGLKHLNRLEQVLARSEWTDATIPEGVMRDTEDHVIEGTMTNLFLVGSDGLKTPDLSQCGVAGIMREVILDAAAGMGMSCEIGRYTLDDLEQADEVFVCNSVIGIWPVRRLGRREYRGWPVTARITDGLVLQQRRP